MAADLSIQKAAFVEWLVSSVEERKFSTQQELADYLGATPETLTRWKKAPEVQEIIAAASMAWGEQQLPGVVNALFRNAKLPGGDKDRMTIVRYFMPAVLKARAEKQLDVLKSASSQRKQVSKELAAAYLQDCTPDEQHKFMLILGAMGAVEDTEAAEEELFVVTRQDDDIIDMPQTPQQLPGRPRGSRKVRLKRQQEQE